MNEAQDSKRASKAEMDDFERFALIVNGPALFNAIVTAIDLDLFRFLEESPGRQMSEIAESLEVEPSKLRVLLFAICATGLVKKRGEGYSNSALASDFFAKAGQDSWSRILPGWRALYYPAFAHLTNSVKESRNAALDAYPGSEDTLYARLQRDNVAEALLHDAMSAFTLRSLPSLLQKMDLGGCRRLLDLGGGDGTTALALVEMYPELQVTLVDLPSVAERARDVNDHERIEVLSGDAFALTFDEEFDAVLCSHFLEVFSPTQILSILSGVRHALRNNGRIYIYGFDPNDQETRGVFSARLALYLTTLATGNGMTYPAGDYETWLIESGFVDVSSSRGLPYEHGLTQGVKVDSLG
ncbi:methyltransferase [Pseudoclavibacter sp. AY1F1]|uniref:methyltransferase n=1 Tax=Pseudoclavibacter sp. AY1F1 TaxID=2080583 RepID=UPI001CA58B38|nr:class I SAM-dependent methyltransferase [Pseudoclavibacter sp. AY1F1]